MDTSDSGAMLSSVLRRFQRRLRLGVFIRQLMFALAVALVVADVVVLVSPPEIGIGATFMSSLAFAVAAAVALAIARTPSLPETARIVDRELQLQDRAASALQFSTSGDPIARLVVAGAAARLEAVQISGLPLSISTPARWFAAAALAVSLAIVAWRGGSPPGATSASGSGRATTEPGVRPQNVQQGRGDAGAPAASHRSPVPPPPSTSSRDSAQQSAATAQVAPGDGAQRGRAMAQETPDGSPPRGDSASPSSKSRLAAAGNATSAHPGAKDGSRTLNASPGETSNPGAAAPGALSGAGGGVRGGAPVAGASAATQGPASPSSDRRTAAYAEAYARAAAAVPAERVPADLRSYVRAYFLAIRPGSNP